MIPLGTLRVILELIFGKVFYGQLSAVYENSERVKINDNKPACPKRNLKLNSLFSGNSGLPRSFFPTSSAAGKHDTVLSGREASSHTDYLGYMCFFLITSMFK